MPSAITDWTRITLATDALVAFTILLIGATAGQAKRMVYKIEGAISNDGGTTTLLASTVTTIYEDDVSFDARVQANDTTDALVIEVQDTDAASDTVLWAYTYRSVEIIF